MPAPMLDEGIDSLEELVSDWDIACDYSDASRRKWLVFCDGNPAEWVVRMKCPKCSGRHTRLLCTQCKDVVMFSDAACTCTHCDEIIFPFRSVVSSIESLRPAA